MKRVQIECYFDLWDWGIPFSVNYFDILGIGITARILCFHVDFIILKGKK